MKRRYVLGGALTGLMPAVTVAAPVLTSQQRSWISQHRDLRFAPEQDYGPFVFSENGEPPRGLSMDVLELVRQRTDLGFVIAPARPLAANLEALRRADVDFTSSLRPTAERAAFLSFTRPYVEFPAVLAATANSTISSLASASNQAVAVGAGYAVESYVRSRYPRVAWVAVPSDVDGLVGVHEGRYAAAVLDVASLAFVTERRQLPALKVVGAVGFEYALCFAVRRELPQLVEILNVGLTALPPSRRQELLQLWLGPYGERLRTPSALWASQLGAACLGGAAAIGGLIAWRHRRGRHPEGGAT